jgi:hypothetical protein
MYQKKKRKIGRSGNRAPVNRMVLILFKPEIRSPRLYRSRKKFRMAWLCVFKWSSPMAIASGPMNCP